MLTPAQLVEKLTARVGAAAIQASVTEGLHPCVTITAEHWRAVAAALREDPELKLDMLRSITGLDYPDRKQLVAAFDLISFDHHHEFCVKVIVPRDKPEMPSVADIWPAADWHERETYDLLGINFTDHPDSVTDDAGTHPRRILLPDDWTGFPLRKDYKFPRDYHGIPGSVELDWAQKPNYPA